MTETPYPMFDFESEQLEAHNSEIRDQHGRYRTSSGPYWIRYRTVSPGKLPTFRVLISPVYGQQHGRQLREEIWHEEAGRWVSATEPAA